MAHQTAARGPESSASGHTARKYSNGTTHSQRLTNSTQGDRMAKVELTRRFTMPGSPLSL